MNYLLLLIACSQTPAAPVDPTENLIVPKIASIATDSKSINAGADVFSARGCGGCHAFGHKVVGPDLVGVTSRRTIIWIEKMVLYPSEMTATDPVAKQLLRDHMVQMPDQGVTDDEIKLLLAYIKSQGG